MATVLNETLLTKRLQLRKLNPADDKRLFALRSNPEMSRFINRKVYETIDETRSFIAGISQRVDEGQAYYWAITVGNEDDLIGTACVFNISQEHHRAEIGYELLPEFQGNGYAQEAVKAVVEFCFTKLNLHSLEAVVVPLNLPSIKVLEHNGFVREAYFKEKEFAKGSYVDIAVYSKLSS